MEQAVAAFTAVFLRNADGYLGFVEELPAVSAHGRSLDEARANLRRMAAVVFDEERRQIESLLEGKEVVRESFAVPLPDP